jgi:hypothetical protein
VPHPNVVRFDVGVGWLGRGGRRQVKPVFCLLHSASSSQGGHARGPAEITWREPPRC